MMVLSMVLNQTAARVLFPDVWQGLIALTGDNSKSQSLPLHWKINSYCVNSVEKQVKSLRQISFSELKLKKKVLSKSLTFSPMSIYLFICCSINFCTLVWVDHITLHHSEAISFHTPTPTPTSKPIEAASLMNASKTEATANLIECEDWRRVVYIPGWKWEKYSVLSSSWQPFQRDTSLSIKTLSLPFSRIFSFFWSASHFHCLVSVSLLNSLNEHVIRVTCVYFDQPLDYITLEILPLFLFFSPKKF